MSANTKVEDKKSEDQKSKGQRSLEFKSGYLRLAKSGSELEEKQM